MSAPKKPGDACPRCGSKLVACTVPIFVLCVPCSALYDRDGAWGRA